MSTNQPTMYALLVGIDDYASKRVPDLGGCVNDVDAMEQLLRDKFKVAPANIKKLTNQAATHQAIKDTFKVHLIGQAQAWVKAGRKEPPPAFLFHYSGHGSQARDDTGTEPDGLDETLVPHDSRTRGVYDIKDWELGQLLDELTQHFVDEKSREYFGNVTVILDCCHSGSGTRDIGRDILPTRRCESDLRPQPTQRPLTAGAMTRGATTASGWLKKDERYVLLAGCRDREEANEHIVREGEGRRQHGALTYFLIKELAGMNPYNPLTYRELHDQVRYQVNSLYKSQMPQCEGDRDREVFGGVRPARDVFLTVVDKSKGFIWVDGGVAHGLTDGSELQVYPPETRQLGDAGEAIATLTVKSVGAIRSGCQVTAGEKNIPIGAKAVIYQLDPVSMQRSIILDIPDDANTLKAVQNRLAEDDVKNYVEVVPDDAPADFRIAKVKNKLHLQDGAGELLVAPFDLDDLHGLGRDLAHLVRYYNALELSNKASNSALAGKVNLEIKKLDFDPKTQQPIARDFERTAGGELIIETGQEFVIRVTNQANIPLYFTLLEFGYAWDIYQWYPEVKGAHEPLAPGQSYFLGLSADPEEQLVFELEDMAEARETYKVIATKEEADFEILTQDELKTAFSTRSVEVRTAETSPINQLLDLAMSMDESTRAAARKRKTSVKDEWTTAQVSFLISRPATDEEATRALRGGTTTTLPGYDLELEPPTGFTGGVRVLTERQSIRAVGDDATELKPPPGLAGFGDLFQPLPVKSTRAVGPTGAVIEIEVDDEARSMVTEETPLKLHLPPELADEQAPVMALAYDGSFFYPVGRPGEAAHVLNVEWLPDSDPTPMGETTLPGRRSLGRTIKLYLYKTLQWEEPSLGLHKAWFVPTEQLEEQPLNEAEREYDVPGGKARYRDIQPGEIKAGQRVALFVHGFTADTHGMVSGPAQFLADRGVKYDHILAFDYETFNTHIGDNGHTLARALRKAGFGPDDGVHLDVFSHSMGTQVVRSMVEQHGGDKFVDCCFLAGPPNQGTRLAEAKRLVPWLGTLLLNQVAPTVPAMIAGWVLKRVTDDAVGPDDLRPNSDFLKALNGSDEEAKVPYYILAGSNELTSAEEGSWKRLAQKLSKGVDVALDTLFTDQHDLVINIKSMKGVRDGHYPDQLLDVCIVPCNHFGYFNTKKAQQQLLAWLT